MMNRLFVSAPTNTKPQMILASQVVQIATDVGFEVHVPKNEDDFDTRMKALLRSNYVLSLFDYLLPKGQFLYILQDVAYDRLDVPLPQNYVEWLGIGMQATGAAEVKPTSGLVLPGQEHKGVEITNVPRAIAVTAPGGVFGKLVGNGALNLPDPTVLFESGVAYAEKIPVIGLALASPNVGKIGAGVCDLLVSELEHLPPSLKSVLDFEDDDHAPSDIIEHMATIQKRNDKLIQQREEKILKEVVGSEEE